MDSDEAGPAVTSEVAAALGQASLGRPVVLIVGPEAGIVDVPLALAASVALFVGDPSDPADSAAALEMATELFARRRA